jgi:hypothetical protein
MDGGWWECPRELVDEIPSYLEDLLFDVGTTDLSRAEKIRVPSGRHLGHDGPPW